MNIIGICGTAGAGKSTVASILVRDHGYTEIAFADVMKRFAREALAFSDDQLWGPSDSRNAPDPRYPRADGSRLAPLEFLQKLGTECGRFCYPNIWVDYAIRVAKSLLQPGGDRGYSAQRGLFYRGDLPRAEGVVISDVRFRNEMDAIHAAGGRVVRIVRASAGLAGAVAAHASEKEQAGIPDDLFDGILYNDSSIEDLAALVSAYAVVSSARAS